jgi:hypothetical protein
MKQRYGPPDDALGAFIIMKISLTCLKSLCMKMMAADKEHALPARPSYAAPTSAPRQLHVALTTCFEAIVETSPHRCRILRCLRPAGDEGQEGGRCSKTEGKLKGN